MAGVCLSASSRSAGPAARPAATVAWRSSVAIQRMQKSRYPTVYSVIHTGSFICAAEGMSGGIRPRDSSYSVGSCSSKMANEPYGMHFGSVARKIFRLESSSSASVRGRVGG